MVESEQQLRDYIGKLHCDVVKAISEKLKAESEAKRLRRLLKEKGIPHADFS